MIETCDGHAGHQKISENSVVDRDDFLRRNSFVVVCIGAGELCSVELCQRGIVDDRQERGQNLLADFLGEGLALAFVTLAMAFQAMPENLVEKHSGRAARKHRRAHVRLGGGSGAQRLQIRSDSIDLGV